MAGSWTGKRKQQLSRQAPPAVLTHGYTLHLLFLKLNTLTVTNKAPTEAAPGINEGPGPDGEDSAGRGSAEPSAAGRILPPRARRMRDAAAAGRLLLPQREGCCRRARGGRRMQRRRGGWVPGGRGPARGVRAVVWRHHFQARAPRPVSPLCARGPQQPP